MLHYTKSKSISEIYCLQQEPSEICTIEDRRKKGWGKLSEISGILAKMPDIRRVEVGLNLRMAKQVNGTVYSSEAWGKVTEVELTRLEQVDLALLKSLVSGHSKTSRIRYLVLQTVQFRQS